MPLNTLNFSNQNLKIKAVFAVHVHIVRNRQMPRQLHLPVQVREKLPRQLHLPVQMFPVPVHIGKEIRVPEHSGK